MASVPKLGFLLSAAGKVVVAFHDGSHWCFGRVFFVWFWVFLEWRRQIVGVLWIFLVGAGGRKSVSLFTRPSK